MKRVAFLFNPYSVKIGNRHYTNVSDASKERLDDLMVRLYKNNLANIVIYSFFDSIDMVIFEVKQ